MVSTFSTELFSVWGCQDFNFFQIQGALKCHMTHIEKFEVTLGWNDLQRRLGFKLPLPPQPSWISITFDLPSPPKRISINPSVVFGITQYSFWTKSRTLQLIILLLQYTYCSHFTLKVQSPAWQVPRVLCSVTHLSLTIERAETTV